MKKWLFIICIPFAFPAPAPAQSYIDYAVAPVAASVIGLQQGGARGASIGFLMGCVDEASIQLGWTQKHHLTAGVLGVGATASLTRPWAPYLGFAGGSLAASGYLNPILGHVTLPASTSLVAASQLGAKGAITGAVCGIVDETLLSLNVTRAPYLSNLLYGVFASQAAWPHLQAMGVQIPVFRNVVPLVAESSLPLHQIVGVLAAAMLSFGKPLYEVKTPLQLRDDLYGVLSRTLDQETLDGLIEKQAIVLVASELSLAALGISLGKRFHRLDTSLVALGTSAEHGHILLQQQDFNRALAGLALFIPLDLATRAASSFLNTLLSDRTSRQIRDAVFERFANEETPLTLAGDKNATVVIEKLNDHLDTVLAGNAVLGGALQSGTAGIFYLSFLQKTNALDLLVVLDLYNRMISAPNIWLSQSISSFEEPLAQAQSIENNLVKDILRESDLLVSGDKIDLVKTKIGAARQKKRSLEEELRLLASVQNGYQAIWHVFGYLAKTYLIGKKLVLGQLAYADSQPAMQAATGISQAMSWQSSNAQKIAKIGVATDALHRLLDELEKTKGHQDFAIYKATQSGTNGIRLQNLSVGVGSTTLVHVPELILASGVYAVTGAQGSGKSALLSKIKGIQGNSFWANGDITYLTREGRLPKRVLVTQKDYLTPYSTLLEVIMSKPDGEFERESTMKRVWALLKEIGFDQTNDDAKIERWLLEEQTDWSMLSGGQKKIIGIVSAIMKQPELLILDETFAGLDHATLSNAQKVLKRELSKSLIFVSEHHLDDNNRDGFYEKELHLAEKALWLKDLRR